MAVSLAIDFDGVIADTGEAKRTWILRETGLCVEEDSLDRSSLVSVMGAPAYARMQDCVGFEDTMQAEPLPGAIDAIERLAASCLVHIVTARPLRKAIWVERWLSVNGLGEIVKSVVSSYANHKMQVAVSVDAACLVDNDVRHYKSGYQVDFILFGRRECSLDRELVQCAKAWPQALDRISRCYLRSQQV